MSTLEYLDSQRSIAVSILDLCKRLDSLVVGERLPFILRNLLVDVILKIDDEKARNCFSD